MDREEAKHILSLCRPGNEEDLKDPVIAEALALLDTDDELCAWFESELDLDTRITDELERIEVPADLKASILAGMRAHTVNSSSKVEGPVEANERDDTADKADTVIDFETLANEGLPADTAKPSKWFTPWAGIAALFAVLFVVAVVQLNKQPGTERLASQQNGTVNAAVAPDVVTFLADQIEGLMQGQRDLDQHNSQLTQLTNHLASNNSPIPGVLPVQLDSLPTIGCVTFKYNDCKLSMICFQGDAVYHLVTTHKKNVDCATSPQPQVFEVKNQAFKLWVDGDQVYILTTQGTKDNLPELI